MKRNLQVLFVAALAYLAGTFMPVVPTKGAITLNSSYTLSAGAVSSTITTGGLTSFTFAPQGGVTPGDGQLTFVLSFPHATPSAIWTPCTVSVDMTTGAWTSYGQCNGATSGTVSGSAFTAAQTTMTSICKNIESLALASTLQVVPSGSTQNGSCD